VARPDHRERKVEPEVPDFLEVLEPEARQVRRVRLVLRDSPDLLALRAE